MELIAAKDLPMTQAGVVDILCVDPATGAMARKNGGGLSGFVLRVDAADVTITESTILCNTVYDELAKALESGCHVTVVFPEGALGTGYPAAAAVVLGWMYYENMLVCMITSLTGAALPVTFGNGTYVPALG